MLLITFTNLFYCILEEMITDTNFVENEKENNDQEENEDFVSIPTVLLICNM